MKKSTDKAKAKDKDKNQDKDKARENGAGGRWKQRTSQGELKVSGEEGNVYGEERVGRGLGLGYKETHSKFGRLGRSERYPASGKTDATSFPDLGREHSGKRKGGEETEGRVARLQKLRQALEVDERTPSAYRGTSLSRNGTVSNDHIPGAMESRRGIRTMLYNNGAQLSRADSKPEAMTSIYCRGIYAQNFRE
jgi:hypothetical protein